MNDLTAASELDRSVCPSISIVTPSYNQGPYIEETIRSVLSQGYPSLEYIVIDGGSTDESVDIIKKHSEQIAYWVSELDRGQSQAINKGFERATGEILGWLNSDDVLEPNALQIVGRYFANHPDCDFLAGFSEFRDESGKNVIWVVDHLPQSFDELLERALEKYLPQPSVFFRRRAVGPGPLLNESLHYALELELWLRLAAHTKLHVLPVKLSWMRMHEDQKTRGKPEAFDELDAIVDPHLHRLPQSKQMMIRKASNRARALACLCNRSGIIRAVRYDKTIIFTRQWVGLTLRSLLPKPIRRLIFSAP